MVQRIVKKLKFKNLVVYTVAFVLGALVFAGINWLLTPKPWSPLGPYPVQSVISDKETISKTDIDTKIPVISLSDGHVQSIGVKCADEEVTVTGKYEWVSLIPGGFNYNYPPVSGSRRIDGCQTFDFQNEIPQEVKKWAEDTLERGMTPEILISGCETPQKDNGKKGVEVCWRTEPFAFER